MVRVLFVFLSARASGALVGGRMPQDEKLSPARKVGMSAESPWRCLCRYLIKNQFVACSVILENKERLTTKFEILQRRPSRYIIEEVESWSRRFYTLQ